ncbi:GNAT family N-acetyltransferase [Amnibacterium setariae]|uniref:N-acetyltransferase n=1 Tax=Amnibacterium setariae TaxID=2306585 RepID=A0A3A1TWZ0_9MICO|nr:GNAT family N-acetyltransferase [Amnibacterium setariae]RIX26658.1 N-acetyltransferase [Amnibacterium setariae]
MTDADDLLRAYDEQLRGDAEALGAAQRFRLGPLWIGVFAGGRGFISYRDLGGLSPKGVDGLVRAALAMVAAEPSVVEIEWKTRGHDAAEGLHEALVRAGFEPQEPESIMLGAAELLALDLPLPDGVTLRSVTDEEDVRVASYAADRLFGDEPDEARVADLLDRIARGAELWVAEADGRVVSTGRLEPVPGIDFAGVWGGATDPAWRRRGIYRALTAARAKSAVRRGVRFINSDSTEYSRPILERSGFVKVSTTTPYEWHR